MNKRNYVIDQNFQEPGLFTSFALGVRLRRYQWEVMEAVSHSVRNRLGRTFVVIFPRQSGKNETQLCLYMYLLTFGKNQGGDIIHVEPTYKPQTELAMLRLETKLEQCPLTMNRWDKLFGHIYTVNQARVVHFSGEPGANVVGATAGLLLSVNEAQDILPDKYDRDFNPMAASSNATRVFWGTRWTSDTLLEREYRAALTAQEEDGVRRVFFVTAEQVGATLEPYRLFVEAEVRRMGRQHPLVRSQYFCETVEAAAGMFPPARVMLMRGAHPARTAPEPGKTYVFCIDVGGQDERSSGAALDNPARDSTVLTSVQVDLDGGDVAGRDVAGKDVACNVSTGPTYRTVHRRAWLGEKHTTVFAQIRALHELWRPQQVVIDATGVGEGLWSLLDAGLPGKVLPVKFSETEKSDIGYRFIQIIETGRLREYAPLDEGLLEQLEHCAVQVRPSAARLLRWGVPEGKRNTAGQFVHDDLLLSLALLAVIDRQAWHTSTPPASVEGFDPLEM